MIFTAIISNKDDPGLGQATIPFPIPDDEYDHTIGLLEDMGIGSPTAQDCRVDGLDSTYPILNRLVAQSVNVDELDYLAKRLDSFCAGEDAQFQAMAEKLDLTNIRDFINLTFCCQQTTVITDFSDLERIGRAHYMNVNGGCANTEELENLDGEETARLLISDGEGVVTPYGVVYDNGMKLEPLYDGRHFPAYLYKPPLMVLEVNPDPAGTAAGCLYLPCPDRQLQRTLLRAEQGQEGFRMEVTMDELPSEVSNMVSPTRDSFDSLNALCRAIEPLNSEQREKLAAVVLMTGAESANEVRQLAENLDQFDFVPKSDSPMADSALTELGYVAYHGSLTLEELMADDPTELYQREQEMGGMA